MLTRSCTTAAPTAIEGILPSLPRKTGSNNDQRKRKCLLEKKKREQGAPGDDETGEYSTMFPWTVRELSCVSYPTLNQLSSYSSWVGPYSRRQETTLSLPSLTEATKRPARSSTMGTSMVRSILAAPKRLLSTRLWPRTHSIYTTFSTLKRPRIAT